MKLPATCVTLERMISRSALANLKQPKIKEIQIQLTGFLEKDTPGFCQQLWKLCMSAQNSPQGVPQELLEAKKAELIQEKVCRP